MKRGVDILIKDGLIFDGTGTAPFVSDIAISGDRIQSVGTVQESNAEQVIPAKGLAVVPGFIDTHAHSDFTLIADPRAEGKLLQGVTTEINGNCGMSAAPLYGKALERREDDLNELGIRERWNTVSEYRSLIERQGTAINIAMLAGHGNIRGAVVGYENKEASQEELLQMKKLLDESIREGAMGLSTGLIYPPGIYAATEELIELCRVLEPYGIIYTSHMRSEGAMLLEAIREVITIGQKAGVKVHISHIKTAGEQNWHKVDRAISLIMDARDNNLQITCDRYPYTASSTDLDSLLPSWAFEGGNDEELRRLMHKETCARLHKELLDQPQGKGYWERVIVSSVASEQNKWMEGKTIAEISRSLPADEIETVFHILVEERLRVGAIFMSMHEDNLIKFLSLPFCAIGSDSSARCFDGPTRRGRPHPRTYGTFPRFLGTYVRDAAVMPLAEAVRRATSLPAEIFGLNGRGRIREGMFADITVFDPARISDRATFDDPFQRPVGIPYVLVNGTPAVWEGRQTGRFSGRMLDRL